MARVFYNGNGNTGGSVPTDATVYNNGDPVTVLGNTGNLVKNGDTFAYWNTAVDGSGTVYFGSNQFNIGAADVTLYAMWYTTAGLNNGGTTTHYQFAYDSVLATAAKGNIEPARTNALLANGAGGIPVIESDFNWMSMLFNNIGLPYSYPVSILVANLGGGAGWGPPILLKPGGQNTAWLRDLMVSEVTEMFMYQQVVLGQTNQGYGFNGVNDEESNGEGLSHYLNEQFEIYDGRPTNQGAFNGNLWLNSSLPSTDPASTRYSGDTPPYDYGSRFDYVGKTINDNRNTPASGCSVLFLWYLTVQLGFRPDQLCQKASPTLHGVYENLTGDNGDPFPFFKALLGNRFPESAVAAIPGSNPDNPFPLAMLTFLVDKSTFGRDEIQDIIDTQNGRVQNAFWLVLEGFNKNTYLNINPTITAFTGSFADFVGAANIQPGAVHVDYENDDNLTIPQRIRLAYDVVFTNAVLANFPNPGDGPAQLELDASVTIAGNVITGSEAATVFELVSGTDPYFTNVNPAQGNNFWLSQDLRVFTVCPGVNNSPFGDVAAGKPILNAANNTGLDTAAGFQYARNLITYLNANYFDPNGTDPFTLLPQQGTAFTDASSVARYTLDLSHPPTLAVYQNYSFAIARVRLKGTAGPLGAAQNVRVFFRVWKTQSPDTDFGGYNYPSDPDSEGLPGFPRPGTGNNTIPFFASGNNGAALDYLSGGNINIRDVQIPSGDTVWAYFACYLNFYDGGNVVNGESVSTNWAVGTHHCIVAEIAYDGAPILEAGLTKNPENCDKLAQRNLQLTFSDNPGIPATHRIPQTFDIKPSLNLADIPGTLLGYPDELMIDWKAIPPSSIATVYWPQVHSADVLALANKLYASHLLSATDTHTLQCKTTKGVTYIPVPQGSGENFAGLFTVEVPPTVSAGQEYDIVVRKVSTHRRPVVARVLAKPGEKVPAATMTTRLSTSPLVEGEEVVPMQVVTNRGVPKWRYVAGSFQVRIPVTTKAVMLAPDESILAIMKARLQAMSPANRWYPVLQRYVAYIAARIDGLGGDSGSIKPSFQGVLPPTRGRGEKDDDCERPWHRFVHGSGFWGKCCGLAILVLSSTVFLLFILALILILRRGG